MIPRVTRAATAIAWALLPACGGGSEPAPPPPPAAVAADPLPATPETAPEESQLLRDPVALPRAAAGRWRDFPAAMATLGPEVRSLAERGTRSYMKRDYPAALEALFDLLQREPDHPPGLIVLGSLYYRLRRYGDAVTCLERFVEVLPAEIGKAQALGHCYYGLGQYERAREVYEAVLAANPTSPEALRGLALSHMRLGDPERALELLARVLELRPEHGEAQAWVAQILFDQGRSAEALPAALRAVEIAPNEPRPWYVLMQVRYDLGQAPEAEEARRTWEELSAVAQEIRSLESQIAARTPKAFSFAMRLVDLQAARRDADGLRAASDQALALRPDQVSELELRGLLIDRQLAAGDHEGVLVSAEELEQRCGQDPRAWQKLESVYTALGDIPQRLRAGDRWRRMISGP